jgi:PAS domain S-box-containing protein
MMFSLRNVNLLYIEDDKTNADLILEYLKLSEHTKFKTTHMSTLDEGLEYIKDRCVQCEGNHQCGIDAILLDLVLPNSAGVATYKSVLDRCPCIPIVIISGHEQMAYECVKLGAQDYLVKPHINPGLIIRSIVYAIERRKLTAKVEESERRFRLLSEAAFEGVVISKNGVIIDINRQFANIIQTSDKNIIGKKVVDFVSPQHIELVAHNMKIDYEGPYEHDAKAKDGTLFPVEINGRTLPDGLRLTAIRDMTKYKESEKSLENSEKKFRNLVELTRAGIYEIDLINHRFTYVNDVTCKQTGYTKEELLEVVSTELLTEKSRIDWTERCKRFIEGGYKVEDYAPFEYGLVRKDGSHVWALIVAEFIKDDQGITTTANIVAIDITKQKLVEDQLKKKEVVIFSQLEDKIHQWRDEITVRSTAEIKQLKIMDSQIKSIGDTSDDKSEVM